MESDQDRQAEHFNKFGKLLKDPWDEAGQQWQRDREAESFQDFLSSRKIGDLIRQGPATPWWK